MNAAVGLMDGLGLDGDQCICVIPRQSVERKSLLPDANGVAKVMLSYMSVSQSFCSWDIPCDH